MTFCLGIDPLLPHLGVVFIGRLAVYPSFSKYYGAARAKQKKFQAIIVALYFAVFSMCNCFLHRSYVLLTRTERVNFRIVITVFCRNLNLAQLLFFVLR